MGGDLSPPEDDQIPNPAATQGMPWGKFDRFVRKLAENGRRRQIPPRATPQSDSDPSVSRGLCIRVLTMRPTKIGSTKPTMATVHSPIDRGLSISVP